MNRTITSLALAAVLSAGILASAGAMAQTSDPNIPGHPRVNEVDQRIDNQQQRIDNGVKDGQITPAQQTRDENHLNKVSNEMSADQAKNGGHITKAEQNKMNNQLNKNSKRIHHQRTKPTATPASAPAAAPAPAATPAQ